MTDALFNELMSLDKCFTRPGKIKLPGQQERKVYDVKSSTTEDKFLFDYDRRGRFELKHKKQLRHGKDVCIIRLEINAPNHMNPDGNVLSRNHIHIYREGYDLSWAYELFDIFPNIPQELSALNLFTIFCDYCKIDSTNIHLQGVL